MASVSKLQDNTHTTIRCSQLLLDCHAQVCYRQQETRTSLELVFDMQCVRVCLDPILCPQRTLPGVQVGLALACVQGLRRLELLVDHAPEGSRLTSVITGMCRPPLFQQDAGLRVGSGLAPFNRWG